MVTYGPNIKFCISLKVCLPLFSPTSDIILSTTPSGGGGGGRRCIPGSSLWGRVGSPNPDPNQKIVIFHTRFQTWPLKSIRLFRPGVGSKKCYHYLH